MDQFSRKIIGMATHQGTLDGPSICRLFNKVIRGKDPPKYLSMDHDPLFRFSQWKRNLRILDIKEIQSVPEIPISHPFIESLIGKIRYEFTDRILFWNKRDLETKLDEFAKYYNESRVHSSLDGKPPLQFIGERKEKQASLKQYEWRSYCRGLFHVPISA